jgi:SAM-dependent methyltransferase
MRRKVNRDEVARELLPGSSKALLQELHLLTRDGDLNADSLRKLKQVNHLVRLLSPALDDVLSRFGDPVVVDCGSGKGYLGFILYELAVGPAGKGTLLGVESRPELAKAATERAARLGYDRMRFLAAEVAGAPVPQRVNLVTALHACDTATDDAIVLAARHGADHLALVPCCQAEVARQLADRRGTDPAIAEMHHHPWHRRELGSHLTNVIRALSLEALGYQVTVTELAGWEHSLKNELILGKKTRAGSRAALERLEALLSAAGVRPKLVREIWGPGPGMAPGSAPDSTV